MIGHKRQIEYLKKVQERGTFSHAYLFYGPKGAGKLEAAKDWVKEFFPADSAILIDENRHPDVLYLSKELPLTADGEKNKKEIGIDQIRELKRRMSLSPAFGGYKFAVIDEAELMSDEAQNSLLKILEEPVGKTVFILITAMPVYLNSTVLSRVVPIQFNLLADEKIRAWLDTQNILAPLQEKIVAMSAGRLATAKKMIVDKNFMENELAENEAFEKICRSDLVEQFGFSAGLQPDPEKTARLFYFLLNRARSEMLGSGNTGAAGFLRQIFSAADLMRRSNVSKRLVLDNIFLNFAK